MPGRVTFQPGAKIERIEKNLDGPARALKQIGALMVAESQRAFKEQAFGAKKWASRAPINIFGIIADFALGRRKPPARRFERRPALRDTGRLAASIAFEVKGPTVEVGTNLEYAAVHHTGGDVESAKITSNVQLLLGRWLKRQSPEIKSQLEFLLSANYTDKTLKSTVPARPFIGITPKTRATVRTIIGVEIMEVGK